MTMLSDPDLDCFNTKPILAVISSPNQTLPQISEEWLKGLCSTGSCSNAAISKTVTALIGGCVNDLKELTSVPDTSKLVDYFQKSYSTFREAACLKEWVVCNIINMKPEILTLAIAVIKQIGSASLWDCRRCRQSSGLLSTKKISR